MPYLRLGRLQRRKRDLTAIPSWSRNSPGCLLSSNRSWVFPRVTHAPYKAVPRYILGWKSELLYAFIAQDRETNHWRSLEQRS